MMRKSDWYVVKKLKYVPNYKKMLNKFAEVWVSSAVVLKLFRVSKLANKVTLYFFNCNLKLWIVHLVETFWMIMHGSGVNFINVLWAALMPVDPKSVKRYWRLDWILMLLGATGVKASRKYVGEIEPRRFYIYAVLPLTVYARFLHFVTNNC